MTIFAVTRGGIENGNILGFKQTKEQILGCQTVEPGYYHLAHGFVEMDVAVGPNDSVSVATDSIMSGLTARSIKFGGSTLKLPVLQNRIQLSVIPRWTKTALAIGPDKSGIIFSLERYPNESQAPVAIGTLVIENALKPKMIITTPRGGAGSG